MEETFGTTVKRGGKYCVAGAAGNKSCQNTSYTNGISMHRFPKNEETRRKWTNFVRRHRPNFSPTSTSHLCSAHFAPTSFTRRLDIGIGDGVNLNRTLQSGVFPTEDTVISTAEEKGPTVTPRERRQLVRSLVNDQLPPSLNEDQNEDHYEPVAHELNEQLKMQETRKAQKQANEKTNAHQQKRAPCCRKCNLPMKGHPRGHCQSNEATL
eukprot:gene5660-10898_t